MADDGKYDSIYEVFLATLAITRQTLINNGTSDSDLYFGLIAKHYNDILTALCNNADPNLEVFEPHQKIILRTCAADFRIHVQHIRNRVLAHETMTDIDCRTYYVESAERLNKLRNPVV